MISTLNRSYSNRKSKYKRRKKDNNNINLNVSDILTSHKYLIKCHKET